MKTSTLVRIANEIRKETGSAPVLTMNQLWAELQRAAGQCRTRKSAREAIKREIFGM